VETLFSFGIASGAVLGMLSTGIPAEIAPHCAYLLSCMLIPEMAQELTPPFKKLKGFRINIAYFDVFVNVAGTWCIFKIKGFYCVYKQIYILNLSRLVHIEVSYLLIDGCFSIIILILYK